MQADGLSVSISLPLGECLCWLLLASGRLHNAGCTKDSRGVGVQMALFLPPQLGLKTLEVSGVAGIRKVLPITASRSSAQALKLLKPNLTANAGLLLRGIFWNISIRTRQDQPMNLKDSHDYGSNYIPGAPPKTPGSRPKPSTGPFRSGSWCLRGRRSQILRNACFYWGKLPKLASPILGSSLRMHECMYACMGGCVCISLSTYIYVCVNISIHIYMCVCTTA